MLETPLLNHLVGHREGSIEPTLVDVHATEPFAMTAVEVHTAVFEVPMKQTLALLPASLHPSVPAYANLTAFRVGDSPIGAFEWAVVGLACRSVIRPRMLTLSAFASTDAAVELLTRQWGFPAKFADVRTRLRHDAAMTRIVLDGEQIFDALTMNPETLLGSARAIRYPQALNFVSRGGEVGLQQHDMAFEYDEGYRGTLSLQTFDENALTGGLLTPTDMIAGTYSKVKVTALPVRIVLDLEEPGKLLESRHS